MIIGTDPSFYLERVNLENIKYPIPLIARYALHEFDQTIRDLYVPRPNGRGGMTRPPTHPIGLKVEAAMASAEIDAKFVCPLRIPAFPPGTHNYNPKRHNLIEGVNKCMISRPEAQAKFREY